MLVIIKDYHDFVKKFVSLITKEKL